jgi:hypothetical protein
MKYLSIILAAVIMCALATISEAATQQVKLTWTDLSNETGYLVERRACGVGSYSQMGTPTTPTFTDTSVVQGTSYGYRVTGTNALGSGPPSDELCVSTAGTPGKVGGLNAIIEIIP